MPPSITKGPLIPSMGAMAMKAAGGALRKVKKLKKKKLKKLKPKVPPKNMTNAQKGVFGEHVSDIHMHNQGHSKLNGTLTNVDDAPIGNGIDGVWKKNPPPGFIITETKYGSSRLGDTLDGKQMSDKWINNRLDKAVGPEQAREIEKAMAKGQVEKRLLHVDENGKVTEKMLE